MLWGESIDHREQALQEFEMLENSGYKEAMIIAKTPPKKLSRHTPSKYADKRFSHAVSANHPWRSFQAYN